MVAASLNDHKPPRLKPSEVRARLATYLHSMCEHVLDATEGIADEPEDGPDVFIGVPLSTLQELRGYAEWFQGLGEAAVS